MKISKDNISPIAATAATILLALSNIIPIRARRPSPPLHEE